MQSHEPVLHVLHQFSYQRSSPVSVCVAVQLQTGGGMAERVLRSCMSSMLP